MTLSKYHSNPDLFTLAQPLLKFKFLIQASVIFGIVALGIVIAFYMEVPRIEYISTICLLIPLAGIIKTFFIINKGLESYLNTT